jgi:hypothetical protein
MYCSTGHYTLFPLEPTIIVLLIAGISEPLRVKKCGVWRRGDYPGA